ncbi:probable ATP-dependent RNA helicase DDX52 [Leptopilina boulardi]|uniref:probable ATP-dependent RNA helicase DDX52 n=1 Tax=Leptopilina boulardi TaxID=63433 RepID=UPI0021F58645|nr:probable ATP-dependent RNA helicase DDX52 [Leptopilina boulardi]
MDAYDIFKTLSAGAKFNLKRFQNDAERFSLIKKPMKEEKVEIKIEPSSSILEELEFSSKRKREDDLVDDGENVLTFYEGLKASKDGKIIKQNKKQKILTENEILEKQKRQEREKVNSFRKQNRISIIGHDVPNPIEKFQQLSTVYKVNNDLLQNMTNSGYKEPTPIQMQAIPVMLEGKQILACAPTGSGKTAAFLFPIIHQLGGPQKKGFRAVILSPTRELAKQTYRECIKISEGRDFRVHIISKINKALSQYGAKSSNKFDILITTPKRLMFLLNQDPPAISLNNVEWLIVDEADKMFEDGTRSFRDQLNAISKACSNPKLRQAMFSATQTPAVTKWCRKNLKSWISVMIGLRNAATDLIEQELLYVGSEDGKLMALRNIIQKGITPPVLVFVQSKERAQELFNELIYDGINVDVIHADRTQTQRDNVVRCFREGKIWFLVCTELMSRGIDFKGVSLVINFDFPPSGISYIHRIGRTGRAGHKGKAITFFTQNDSVNLRSIAEVMRDSGCEVPEYMLEVKKYNRKTVKKLEHVAPKRKTISTKLKQRRRFKERNAENKDKSSSEGKRKVKKFDEKMTNKSSNKTTAQENSVKKGKNEISKNQKKNKSLDQKISKKSTEQKKRKNSLNNNESSTNENVNETNSRKKKKIKISKNQSNTLFSKKVKTKNSFKK